nr:stalk domain-containing protein [uncultured Anaerotignum sp.]
MKRLLRGTFLFLFLFLCSMQTAAGAAIRVFLDDKAVSFPEAPFIENDRVLVPMRGILEALGYSVQWQEAEKTVLAQKDAVQISLRIHEKTATVNGETVSIDAPATIKNDRTFVPLRFLAEHSGAEVTWNQSTSSVSIHSAAYTAPEKTENNDSVVYIQTNKMQGSGIVLSKDGLIATNYHVIKNAATAQFIFADGTVYYGQTTVVGLDTYADIALLKIDKADLTPATPAFSYQSGDAVTAIGSPNGVRNTVSTGVIEGFDRDVISTSAVIAPGSSGGGLFNSKGEVIGMTSFFGDSHYFSIPIAQVLQVPQKLSLPIRSMQSYTYTAEAPRNLRVRMKNDGYAYVSWSPVYNAEHYYVYKSLTPDGPYTRIKNNTGEKWLWGYPQAFAISVNSSCYLRITAVVDGTETAPSESIRILKK